MRPIADLIEEAVERLSGELLYAMAGRRAAQEIHGKWIDDYDRLQEQADPLTGAVLEAPGAIGMLTNEYGIDADVASCQVWQRLVAIGVSEAIATKAVERNSGSPAVVTCLPGKAGCVMPQPREGFDPVELPPSDRGSQ